MANGHAINREIYTLFLGSRADRATQSLTLPFLTSEVDYLDFESECRQLLALYDWESYREFLQRGAARRNTWRLRMARQPQKFNDCLSPEWVENFTVRQRLTVVKWVVYRRTYSKPLTEGRWNENVG